MTIPILSTKLHIPPPPHNLVPRAHLVGQLRAGSPGKLVLVSAPAGFGKTSLIAEWTDQCMDQCLVSWVHLDESDNDLVRFLSYIIAALRTHYSDFGEAALSGLESTPPVPIEAALTSLINEIDSIEAELILILDDYHLIDTTSIHEAIGFLIEHQPAHMCLVITTRTDPPLPIHRLRARGQMTEIRVHDLRFNSQETRSFLEGILNTSFSTDDLTALESRIEGWAAGLQMVALSMQGREDAHKFIETFSGSHRYIMDYLTEEIYNLQPPHIQKFLLRTSILDRLSGPLCDYLLGADSAVQERQEEFLSAQQILEYLERANLFLLPMDNERHWYRYHHLFASLLRQRMRQTTPEQISGLQRRASDWFASNGSSEEAFQYALAAKDFQAAAQIVERNGYDLLRRGALSILLGWLNKLPEEIVKIRPQLSVVFAWTLLLAGKTVDVEEYLAPAEEQVILSGDTDDLLGEIAAIRAYAAALREDVDRTLEQAKLALELLPEDNFTVRSVVAFVLGGVYYLQGDMPRALVAMKEASRNGERSGNIHVAVSALNSMASILLSQGKLDEAEEVYTRALELGTSRSGLPLPITASIYAGYARLHLARKDLPSAREYARIGIDLGEQWINADSQIGCLLTLAQVAQLEGDTTEALDLVKQARHLAATHVLTPGTEMLIENYESTIYTQNGGRTSKGLLLESLSERELEVLKLMAEGCTNSEIADKLVIALGTVKAHTSSIYRKLNVRGRTEAVIKAGELGFL